jgi:hypothetical protein
MGGYITKVKTVDLEVGKSYKLNSDDINYIINLKNSINYTDMIERLEFINTNTNENCDNGKCNNDSEEIEKEKEKEKYDNGISKDDEPDDDIILGGILISKKQCKRGPYGGQEPMYTLVFRLNNVDKEIIKKWDYCFEEVTSVEN